MTIVGVVGVGKARGVSTIACGIAAAAAVTAGSSLLVESDVAGGDIGSWRKIDVDNNSMIEATAAVTVADTPEERLEALSAYCSRSEGSPTCSVLSLRPAGELETQVRAFWRDIAGDLKSLAGPVVVDLGRFDARGASSDVWRQHIDVGIVVANGDLASLKRLHHGSKAAPVANRFPTLMVVNGSKWSLGELRSKIPDVHSLLRWDAKVAQLVRVGNWKKARRTGLGLELNELCTASLAEELV